MTSLYSQLIGDGEDLLVLLHGMGATGDIWLPFIEAAPGDRSERMLYLDLPGHGSSSRLQQYTLPLVVAHLAALIDGVRTPHGSLRILGHSYGGVVALALASAGPVLTGGPPERVYGLGIKSVWTEREVDGMRALAAKPPKVFGEKRDAENWYRKVSGLAAVGESGSGCAGRGIREFAPGQWSLSQDPTLNAIAPPPMAQLTADAVGRFSLAYGEDDPMVDAGDLARFDARVKPLPGGAHNIMVENPKAVWAWLAE